MTVDGSGGSGTSPSTLTPTIEPTRSRIMAIEKLAANGTNYRYWKVLCASALETLRLEHHIAGDMQPTKPSGMADDVWNTQAAWAKAQIVQSVDGQELDLMDITSTAWRCWNDLKSVYEPANISRQLSLKIKLSSTKMREGDDLKAHLAALQSTLSELKQAGGSLDNQEYMAIILMSLPPSYENLSQILFSQIKSLTPLEVRQELLSNIIMLSKNTTPPPIIPTAGAYIANTAPQPRQMTFVGPQGGRQGNRAPFDGTCWDCLQQGHRRGDQACPQYAQRVSMFGSGYHRRGGRPGGFQPRSATASGDGNGGSGSSGGGAGAVNGGRGLPTSSPAANQVEANVAATPTVGTGETVRAYFSKVAHSYVACIIRHTQNVEEHANAAIVEVPATAPGWESSTEDAKIEAVKAELVNTVDNEAILASFTADTLRSIEYHVDSGCSQHMTPLRGSFTEFRALDYPVSIVLADGKVIPALGEGTITLPAVVDGEIHWVSLKEVLYAPGLAKSLISVSQLITKRLKVLFDENKCRVVNKSGEVVFLASQKGTLYNLDVDDEMIRLSHTVSCNTATVDQATLWHRRFGHLGEDNLRKLSLRHLVDGIPDGKWAPHNQCEVCAREKATRSPHHSSQSRAERSLQLVHSDLIGPIPTQSLGGGKYIMTFTDDHTRHIWVYILAKKSEAANTFRDFVVRRRNETSKYVNTIRTDNAGDLTGGEFEGVCKEFGIEHELTAPYSPESNGRGERVNRTLFDRIRCMLDEGNLPDFLWGELAHTAAHLQNRSPHRGVGGEVPLTLWSGKKPDVSHLRVIGSKCFYMVPPELRKKLDQRAREAVLVGYDKDGYAYRLWDRKAHRIIRSTDVIFHEPKAFDFKAADVQLEAPTIDDDLDTPAQPREESTEDQTDKTAMRVARRMSPEFELDAPLRPGEHDDIPGRQVEVVPEVVSDEADGGAVEAGGQGRETLEEPEERVEEADGPVEEYARREDLELRDDAQANTPPSPSVKAEVKVEEPFASRIPRLSLTPMRPTPDRPRALPSRVYDTAALEPPPQLDNLPASRIPKPYPVYSRGRLVEPNYSSRPVRAPKPPTGRNAMLAAADLRTPRNLREAMISPQWRDWQRAKCAEIMKMEELEVWEVVPASEAIGKKLVGCKWVDRIKQDEYGEVEKFKARLCAQGNTQVLGEDYNETFAPVASLTTIRTMIAVAAAKGYEIHNMDVNSAFLHGELDEIIYMKLPPGFELIDLPDACLHLKKSIYGLKQASRVWNKYSTDRMTAAGYTQSQYEPCLFFKTAEDGSRAWVCVYVDDFFIMPTSLDYGDKIKNELMELFDIEDRGPARFALGIQIIRDPVTGSISLSQKQYFVDALEKYGMSECRPVSTPLDDARLDKSPATLPEADQHFMADKPYKSVLGTLMYGMCGTRPDLAFAVGYLSQFAANPGPSHWTALTRVLRYVKGTLDARIVYHREEGPLVGYTDATWASDIHDRRSVGAYVFTLARGPISWRSKKQETIAGSSVEAEYKASMHAAREATWLRRILSDFDITPKEDSTVEPTIPCTNSDAPKAEPTTIFADNQGAIALSKNPESPARTKHIEVAYHYVREVVARGIARYVYIPTRDMIADALTKPLGRVQHFRLFGMMGLDLRPSGGVEV